MFLEYQFNYVTIVFFINPLNLSLAHYILPLVIIYFLSDLNLRGQLRAPTQGVEING